MQDGGTEKISINDPRYPELYKNRQVGLSYDGTISLPDLDEVTITAPRSYTMDSLRDFTTAALYGAPANAMKLSMIPQAAMTEGIEALRDKPYDFSNVNPNFGGFASNQRDLSQTMGYENPEGFLQNVVNFGLSAVDPVSLIGAGIADDLTKGVIRKNLKNFRMSAPPEIARGLKTSGLSFNFNNKKLLPNDYSFQSDDNRYWLKHKDKNIGQIEYMSPQLDSQNRKWGTVNIEIDPMYRGKGLSAPMYQKILDHADQLGHYGIVSIDGSLQSPKQSKSIRKYFSGKYSEDPKVLENINKGIDEYNDIIKEDNLIFGDNEPLKPYESKFYLMSNKSKFKKGGVVKDNQGYWNPENWGKPVEIDSNNITMEGVYEPLLGVSDTGDTKLMKPGKNYKFKGKKVTEYPVAKLGINQLDAQPMKKLNQLLNFTNNPDKDNWLDKYN
jgi:predicted GNAT family acetyltransferase